MRNFTRARSSALKLKKSIKLLLWLVDWSVELSELVLIGLENLADLLSEKWQKLTGEFYRMMSRIRGVVR